MKPVRATALRRWAKGEADRRAKLGRACRLLEAATREYSKAWGMGPGGSGYGEKDEARAHGVKTRSFKADVARKQRLRKAMPGADSKAKVARATMAGEGDSASGEISALLHEPEIAEQASTLGKGRPDGMGTKGRAYACGECGEAHATAAHAAVIRKRAAEAIRAFAVDYVGPEVVALQESRDQDAAELLREAADLIRGAGMDADRAEGKDPATTGDDDEARVAVNYRYASDPERSCATCVHYVEDEAKCALYEFAVRSVDTCDSWEAADEQGDQNDDAIEDDE